MSISNFPSTGSALAVVTASGDIDLATVEPFRTALLDATRDGAGHVVVDLTAVEFMGSVGLGALATARNRVYDAGGIVALAGCSPMITRLLEITGLIRVLPRYDTVAAARRAIAAVD